MHALLEEYFNKKGIKFEELDEEEQGTFNNWKSILDGKNITVEKIVKFIDAQLTDIDRQLRNLDNREIKNERLIIQQVVYKTIKTMIESPNKERVALEARLKGLLHTNKEGV